jgi:hypothetical protein
LLLELEQRGTALRVYTVTNKVADVKAEREKELFSAGTIARV